MQGLGKSTSLGTRNRDCCGKTSEGSHQDGKTPQKKPGQATTISFHQEITPARTCIREDICSLEKFSQKGSELRNKWNRWRQSAVTWVFVAQRMVHRETEFLLPEIL